MVALVVVVECSACGALRVYGPPGSWRCVHCRSPLFRLVEAEAADEAAADRAALAASRLPEWQQCGHTLAAQQGQGCDCG